MKEKMVENFVVGFDGFYSGCKFFYKEFGFFYFRIERNDYDFKGIVSFFYFKI